MNTNGQTMPQAADRPSAIDPKWHESQSSIIEEVMAETKRWDALKEQADTAVDGGLLPHLRNGAADGSAKHKAAARAIAMTGAELGISPMSAFRTIYFFDGKITIAAAAMQFLAEKRVRGFTLRIIKSNEYGCSLMCGKHGRLEEPFQFSLNDAVRAELGYFATNDDGSFVLDGNGKPYFTSNKDNWRKYPAAMCRARAVAAAVRAIAPEAIMGLLAREELEDGVTWEQVFPSDADAKEEVKGAEALKATLRNNTNGPVDVTITGEGSFPGQAKVADVQATPAKPDKAAAPPGFPDFVPSITPKPGESKPADAPQTAPPITPEKPKRGGGRPRGDAQTAPPASSASSAQSAPMPLPSPVPQLAMPPANEPAPPAPVAPPIASQAPAPEPQRTPEHPVDIWVNDMSKFITEDQFDQYRMIVIASREWAELNDSDKQEFGGKFRAMRSELSKKAAGG